MSTKELIEKLEELTGLKYEGQGDVLSTELITLVEKLIELYEEK